MSLFRQELIHELNDFYRNAETFKKFQALQQNRSKTKIYNLLKNCQHQDFELFVAYCSQVLLYGKKMFDIYCRGERLFICKRTYKIFHHDEKSCRIETTLPQLNFFRFLIQENVLERLLKVAIPLKKWEQEDYIKRIRPTELWNY